MKDAAPVLALDSSGDRAATALGFATSGRRPATIAVTCERRGEDLADLVSSLLEREGLGVADLAALAVVTGPGSYTGLRIGLALVRGLALVDRTPVVGVGALELAALSAARAGSERAVVLPAATARAYLGIYRCQEMEVRTLRKPELLAYGELATELRRLPASCGVCAESAEKAPELWTVLKDDARHLVELDPLRAGVLAELGRRRLLAGRVSEAASVMPVYVGPGNARRNRNRVALDPGKIK